MSKIMNQYYSPPSAARFEKTDDGFLRCHARILREGIMPYARSELQDIPPECIAEPIMMFVGLDSMGSGDALRSLEGAGVTVGAHEWITPQNASTAKKGNTAGAPQIVGPFLEVDLLVTDPEAISRIESGELPEISAAYHADSQFEPGEFDGQHFNAKQCSLRFNHIAIVPLNAGRAGSDVKILNSKEKKAMELLKIKLPRTGRFINTDEEGSKAVEEESKKNDEVDGEKDKSLTDTMGELESKKGDMTSLQAEIDELKGELAVYKKKLDELLSDEAVEKKADEMNEEQGDADDIIENMPVKDDAGKDVPDEKKEEFKNSLKKLHGTKLHSAVLKACGVKIENTTPEGLKGAFKALTQIVKTPGRSTRTVSGHKLMNEMPRDTGVDTRSAHERLGYAASK